MVEKMCLDKSKKSFFLRDDGEELILSASKGLCSITEVGVVILRGLNIGNSIKEIFESIKADYDVSDDELKADMAIFCNDLHGLDIISDAKKQIYYKEINNL